ncbi:glycoside hydrolase family protein [Novosphingobium rosa]|uniref:family 43 glycosylhydrolase n=1 Tax=Novosphingobium rosa TaxID=76978 RepID=UPI000B1E307B|nr:family 43 glycosylhydrolase [Novosphingobium rosa]
MGDAYQDSAQDHGALAGDAYALGATRRQLLIGGAALAGSTALSAKVPAMRDPVAACRTPHKLGRLVLKGSGNAGAFDWKSVDCPFVFSADGRFHMFYTGFDGTGYQTGLAVSDDLVNWERKGLAMARDPHDPVTRYNISSASILRENGLWSAGRLTRVHGRYLAAWHAYPSAGYEEGAAVIGLAWSDDLIHWERTAPILRPEDGAEWERGGLYKPNLIRHGDEYLLFYNAKTSEKRWHEQTGLATSRDLKTWTRHPANPLLRNGPAGAWDDRFASDPAVFQVGDRWAMFYFGLSSDGKARELLALGDDPFTFRKVPEILVDPGAPGAVDHPYAHKPSLIAHQGDLYHFYCAVGGAWPHEVRGISVARSRPW